MRRSFAHDFLIGIDTENLYPMAHELACQGTTKPPQANDDDRGDVEGGAGAAQRLKNASQ